MKVQLAEDQGQVTQTLLRICVIWTPVEQGWRKSWLLHVAIEAPGHEATRVEDVSMVAAWTVERIPSKVAVSIVQGFQLHGATAGSDSAATAATLASAVFALLIATKRSL